jgi:uncharacterized membrane protein
MDLYTYAKLFHIAFAVIWIGGGFCLMVLAIIAGRSGDDQALVHVIQNVIYLGNRMFVPSALMTLLFGIAMVLIGGSFGDLWIILGLAGFTATFVTGTFILKPAAERIGAMIAEQGITPAVAAECRELIRKGKFDYVMLFLIVAVMVLKPMAQDQLLLAAMAGILIVSAIVFLGDAQRTSIGLSLAERPGRFRVPLRPFCLIGSRGARLVS